jgi:hypothetical protein
MTKKKYTAPTITKIKLEDSEVASMVAVCKTQDLADPQDPINDCELGAVNNNDPLNVVTAANACLDPVLFQPCSGQGS